MSEGDQIDILATQHSAYGYMAIEGGFSLKSFCSSVSVLSRAQIGPNEGKKIKINDRINIKTEIKKQRVAGRGTHFCPSCQKKLY